MSPGAPSPALYRLLDQCLPSMDHVAVLLAVRAGPEASLEALGTVTRIERPVLDIVVRDLMDCRLLREVSGIITYERANASEQAVSELDEFNKTKPVTLVRAIYDRASRDPAQRFADAFRVRKER